MFAEVGHDERQEVMDLLNKCYDVETGNTGLAFKNTPRILGLEDLDRYLSRLKTAKTDDGVIVGVVGVVEGEDGLTADIGPLAVSPGHQGQGVGGWILTTLEHQYPVTMVGVVSCRSDVLPWYERRGYRDYDELPLIQAGVVQEQELTRSHLTYIKKQKINKFVSTMLRISERSEDDKLETIVAVINEAFSTRICEVDNIMKSDTNTRIKSTDELKDEKIIVAKIVDQIVGVVCTHEEDGYGIVRMMSVLPQLQGHGIASQLLQELENLYEKTKLTIVTCKRDVLGEFYERRGYQRVREKIFNEKNFRRRHSSCNFYIYEKCLK